MVSNIPDNDEEFDALMRDIDRELAESGRSIAQRPINAVIVTGRRFGISLPLVTLAEGLPPDIVKYLPVTKRIHRWYELHYGNRIKLDFSPGRMVLLVDGDPWVLRFPRIYGSVLVTALKVVIPQEHRFTQGQQTLNVVQLIEDMPKSRIETLSSNALDHILECFYVGQMAFDILESSKTHELIRIVCRDIDAAVADIMRTNPRYGSSKWESLQAAEKTLKAVITLAGSNYNYDHNLSGLASKANQAGIEGNWYSLIRDIQCTPSIRYGEETCNLDEAIAAHQASLKLVNDLYVSGAKLSRKSIPRPATL